MSHAKELLGAEKYKAVRKILRYGRTLTERYNDEHKIWQDDLAGGCGFGAGLVCWLMLRAGYQDVYIVYNHDHCWVEWYVGGETVLLDITASQFGLPKTLLREKRRCPWRMYNWTWGMRRQFKPQTSPIRFARRLLNLGCRETHVFFPGKVKEDRCPTTTN